VEVVVVGTNLVEEVVDMVVGEAATLVEEEVTVR